MLNRVSPWNDSGTVLSDATFGLCSGHLLPIEIVEAIFVAACFDATLVSIIIQLSRRYRDIARRLRYRGFLLSDQYSEIDLAFTSLLLTPHKFPVFTAYMEWTSLNNIPFDIAPYITHLTLSSSENFCHFYTWLLRSTMQLTYLKVNGEYFNTHDMSLEFSALFHSVGLLKTFHDRTGGDLFSFLPTQTLFFMQDLTVMLPSRETWKRIALFAENLTRLMIIQATELTDADLELLEYPLALFSTKGRSHVTHVGIEHVIEVSMNTLVKIQVESMYLATLSSIIPLLAQCTSLEHIHINYASSVSYPAFLGMVRQLPRLSSLRLSLDVFEEVDEGVTALFTGYFMGSRLQLIALSIQCADQRILFISAIEKAKLYFREHEKVGLCDYKVSKCRA